MTKKTVYLETSFISYLTSRESSDIITAGHQSITRQWWGTRRQDFELFTSELVLIEAQRGDPVAVEKRLSVLADLISLDISVAAEQLAMTLINQHAVPEKASEDALHIAIASVNKIRYLLTWNCKHIANAECFDTIERVCTEQGYTSPIMCTPEELSGVH